MKDNDELKFEKLNQFEDDARAVNESELLPIYDAMSFSGDIQPVEDVVISEYKKTPQQKERGESRKTDIKKKSNPIFSSLNTIPKKIVAVILVAVVLIGAAAGATVGIINRGKNELPVKSIFEVNSEMQLMLTDGTQYALPDAQEIKVSDNAMMLYYSRNASSKTGKFDLRAVNVSKKSSLKKAGSLIDNEIDEGWQINSDGTFLSYSKTKSGLKSFYLYSAETGKTQEVSTNVEQVFLPSKGDVIYFTRRIGSTYSLHRMRYGEASNNVASGIDYVNFCNSDKGFEVLYTVKTGNSTNVDVFIVRNLEEPVKVCADVSEVYANDYTYGGNLYYFTKNNSTVNWQDFINDTYAESDMGLKYPVESDYMVEKGFIFKRYVLDTAAYNTAKKKYEAKQKRDKIREELSKIDLGIAVEDDYTCYVYNGLTTKKLASGIKLDNVLGCSLTEAPRIIYRKSVIAVDNKIAMDKLMTLASDGNVSDAVEYVRDKVGGAYDLSDDCIYTWYDGTRVLEFTVSGYDTKKTEFIPASSSALYALTGGELYYSGITQSDLGKGILIDTNVTDCTFENGVLYYEKSATAEKSSLYRHTAKDSKQHICDNLYSYFPVDTDYVLLLTKQQADSELMDIGVFEGGKFSVIDTDASLKNFIYNGRSFAYIKNLGSSEIHNAGEMYICTPENGVKKCSDDVTKTVYVK